MNKSELVHSVAEKIDIPKATAAKAVDAIIDSIKESLTEGDPVTLIGFGTFSVRDRAARTGRNPKTGDPIEIKEAKVPIFKPGKALKEAVDS
jgi:DNA-binding protein HU-beta